MSVNTMTNLFSDRFQHTRDIQAQPVRFLRDALARHPWRVALVSLSMLLAFGAEGFFPYFVKRLVDAISHFSGEIQDVWRWGAGILLAYIFYAVWLRIGGYTGIQLLVSLKTEMYRLFLRNLPEKRLNDEPGTIIQSVAIVGEGSEALLHKGLWQGSKFLINFLIQLSLILTMHYYIFGIFCGWILLHIVSNSFLATWKKKFSIEYQQATNKFKGQLINFCRGLMYTPGKRISLLSDDMYQIDSLLDIRASKQLIDWRVNETILLIYNAIHGFFMILALILILVLWQDKLISTGDIAMSVSILLSTQRMLKEVSVLLNALSDAYAQIETGLSYINAEHQKGLKAGGQ